MTTDSVEPNSMHQAVWKSTVAILDPTVRITRQPSDHATSFAPSPFLLSSQLQFLDFIGFYCSRLARHGLALPRTVNGTGHTGPSEFCATSL